MQYNRNNMSDLNTFKNFSEGVHRARITNVVNKKSKSGKDMFQIDLEGEQGEQGSYWLTFGLDWSDANLNRLLASIEDNNQTIAPLDYGFNQNTLGFLKNKRVFIMAKAKTGTYIDKNGEEKQSIGTDIKNFLTKEEFSKNQASNQTNFHDSNATQQTYRQSSLPGTDPFQDTRSFANGGFGGAVNISDDDLPF
ncbi:MULTISPECIES: single-stranded DNA-binding protein [unclassified Enterococcus]|jgi:hypothetical protein|uniref:single-stranded DNA-binding protein n=1 Tax=unclassified Enterococcus TaxID=2608891 RepID=UPI003F2200AE